MTPELVFVLRVVLLSVVVLGLERLLARRALRRAGRGLALSPFVQPNPVVRLSRMAAPPVTLNRASVNEVQMGTTQPTTTIVRLEPLPRATDYVTEKRAA